METKTESTTQNHDHPERAADRLDELKQAAEHVAAGLELVASAIKKRPLLAVGIGFGIGYVLARILHRD